MATTTETMGKLAKVRFSCPAQRSLQNETPKNMLPGNDGLNQQQKGRTDPPSCEHKFQKQDQDTFMVLIWFNINHFLGCLNLPKSTI